MISSFTGEYHWLANDYPCSVYLEGVEYPSVEHAYQAAKCPPGNRGPFLTCTAGEAKPLGRVFGQPRSDKVRVMKNLLAQKFAGPMRHWLIATGSQELVEGNDWGDTFWGVCDGLGTNMLGQLLMQIRRERPWED